jgi:hypothetical protein
MNHKDLVKKYEQLGRYKRRTQIMSMIPSAILLIVLIIIFGTLFKAASKMENQQPLMTGECQFDDIEDPQPCYYFKK